MVLSVQAGWPGQCMECLGGRCCSRDCGARCVAFKENHEGAGDNHADNNGKDKHECVTDKRCDPHTAVRSA